MLIKYQFKNFCSFADLSILDLVASTTKVKNRFPNNFNTTKYGILPLKTLVIVGENAGGKTNFIKSINFFKFLFETNNKKISLQKLINTNNICSENPNDCDTKQYFSLEVLINNTLYIYDLEIDWNGIVSEKLSTKNTNKSKEKNIFIANRAKIESKETSEEILFKLYLDSSPSMNKVLSDSLKSSNTIGLFVNKLALLGNQSATQFVNWVNTCLYAENIFYSYDLYKDFNFTKDNDDLQIINDEKFIEILRMVDYSIDTIDINEEHPFTKTLIKRKKENGNYFSTELASDSSGVREFFAWAVQIFRVVYENKTIFADEMDRVLNPILSDRVISFINGMEHTGQFIITSHNALHLDLKKYMKEQIYFITKNRETLNSELYSLADFPEVRYETTKIHEFYMKGILGGTSNE